MDLLDRYSTNKEHATEGVKMELGGGNWIKLAYAGPSNPTYASTLQRVIKPHSKNIKRGLLDENKDRELLAKVYAECIVQDWGGPSFKKHKIEKCTKANVLKLLTEKPEFFLDVQDLASNMEYFADDYVEAATKNS